MLKIYTVTRLFIKLHSHRSESEIESESEFIREMCFLVKFASVWCEWSRTRHSYPFEAILPSLILSTGVNGVLH